MARRDPEITARNREIQLMSGQLKELLPTVLAETDLSSEQSLNAKYGGKFADYIDIQNEVIHSPEHFISLYLEGFQKRAKTPNSGAHGENFQRLRSSEALQHYLYIFLRRVYLRYIDALSKRRPRIEDSAIWIGQNHANYGLLITPRFSERQGQWENDKSEIRHFEPLYWSVGHVLQTGLVIPGCKETIPFRTAEEYLNFFLNVIVRNSGSKYEYELAKMYREYVLSAPDPASVPLLIPELRYEGVAATHRYRLDFTIIEPFGLTKVGFELSPWSTHGYLSKIGGLTVKEINEMARNNFEHEMTRHKEFFRRHGIFTLIYTDSDLANLETIFADIKKYLAPKSAAQQLQFHIIHDILGPNH